MWSSSTGSWKTHKRSRTARPPYKTNHDWSLYLSIILTHPSLNFAKHGLSWARFSFGRRCCVLFWEALDAEGRERIRLINLSSLMPESVTPTVTDTWLSFDPDWQSHRADMIHRKVNTSAANIKSASMDDTYFWTDISVCFSVRIPDGSSLSFVSTQMQQCVNLT